MAREVIDDIEDHFNSIRTEWHVMREKWFCGEKMDPVFEGVVKDFCTFDEQMRAVQTKVAAFMKGVEQFTVGLTSLCDGVASGLAHVQDAQIASESCKLREATLQIARADAPHSALAKLRRDLQFNVVTPVQNHIANNRNLKASLDTRRRRLLELTSAQKHFDECVRRQYSQTDRRLLQAKSVLESARMTFIDVDRHVFEWLYILEEYRGDILDSTLQTLKYLQYEFFASSAHSISGALPARMEFRPMVEMTPEHLETQVEMELQSGQEDNEDLVLTDFASRLIEKKIREEPEDAAPVLPVDPLSLSSLMMQGFEEGPARRALRLHQNDTQAAMDWLVNGGCDDQVARANAPTDGVRLPTTVRRVARLKAMRKAQQKKLREQREQRDREREERDHRKECEREHRKEGSGPRVTPQETLQARAAASPKASKEVPVAPPAPADLLELGPSEPNDLLGMEDPVVPSGVPPSATSLIDLADSSVSMPPSLHTAADQAGTIEIKRQSESRLQDPLADLTGFS